MQMGGLLIPDQQRDTGSAYCGTIGLMKGVV